MDSEDNQTPPPEDLSADDFVVEAPAGPDEDAQLKAIIEAAIYITDEPLTPAQIAAALAQPAERVNRLLDELTAEYNRPERGLSIREIAGGYKMATKPEHHEAIRTFVKNLKPPLKLSLPALETLAVIAYKQPVTAPEIMEIRGVQGVGVLKTLLDRKLIAAAGRKHVVGKPILYKTTKEFLVQFGLKDLAELPTLKEFEELGRLALDEPVAQLSGPVSESDDVAQVSGPVSESDDVAQVSGPVSESDVAQVSRPVSADEPEPPKPDGAPTEDEEAQASGPVPR
jgi:segregation and condensation protein B